MKVTLQLTVSQSLCLGVEPLLAVSVVSLWGALSDETSGLSFARQSLQYLVVFQYVHKYLHLIYLTYKVYIQDLCQSGLSTANYALFIIAQATTAV
jgi:hypothetical protein